ncbi:MAG TPA: sugar nucleotide-binding protein [Candidatus Thermoplasmatota archaeon]|nr:sugar nucleotide-binding protein [Candidatus Thermoplasmatota archaeon]
MNSNQKATKQPLIIVTGSNGYIGKSLLPLLHQYRCIGIDIKTNTHSCSYICQTADLRKPESVKKIFEKYTPDIVYHFAALIQPQINEQNPELAKESHINITQNILDCISSDTHLFFLSTDKVFDGSHPHPNEESPTNPLWKYGEFKLHCEKMIQEQVKNHHILRLPIMHSLGSPDSSSFIDKAFLQIIDGKTVQIYDNVFRCYVFLSDLLKILKNMIDDTHYGVYHVGTKMMSYYERVKNLCDAKHIEYEGLLQPVQGSANPMKQNLDTSKIRSLFHIDFQ